MCLCSARPQVSVPPVSFLSKVSCCPSLRMPCSLCGSLGSKSSHTAAALLGDDRYRKKTKGFIPGKLAPLQVFALPLSLFFLFSLGLWFSQSYIINHLNMRFFQCLPAKGLKYFTICILKCGCSRTSNFESFITVEVILQGSPSVPVYSYCTCQDWKTPTSLSLASVLGILFIACNHLDIISA